MSFISSKNQSQTENYWDHFWIEFIAAKALDFLGATTPNPPVGACLVFENEILGLGVHQKAGEKHAEALAIEDAKTKHPESKLKQSTLYVTLEPCNHQGKQPPCTEAILNLKPKRIVYACKDPNPHVQGGGAEKLSQAGILVENISPSPSCIELLKGFSRWIQTGKPYLIHKMAYRFENQQPTMIPKASSTSNTFSRPESLKQAHLQRKWSDAILTDRATVLKDNPRFTVREISDHSEKKRTLVVLSSSFKEIPDEWKKRQIEMGFNVFCSSSITEAIENLGNQGAHRVLIECGPTVSDVFIQKKYCQERMVILHDKDQDFIWQQFL